MTAKYQPFLLHNTPTSSNRQARLPPLAEHSQHLHHQQQHSRSRGGGEVGRLTFVVATTTTTIIDKDKSTGGNSRRRRVVGVEKNDILETSHAKEDYPHCGYTTFALDDNNVHVCTHTVATIPRGISNDDALSTAAAALVGVHCAIPKGVVTNVDGGGGGGGDGRGKDNNDNDNNNNDAIFYTGKAVVLGGNTYTCVIADGLAT